MRADGRLLRVLKGAEDGSRNLVVERGLELQKLLISITVAQKLRMRPEPALLIERGVLRAHLGTSTMVLERTLSLHKALIKQSIDRKLKSRSEPERLLERGVLVQAAPVLPHELPLVEAARHDLHRDLMRLCRLLRSYLDLRYDSMTEEKSDTVKPRPWTLQVSAVRRQSSARRLQ